MKVEVDNRRPGLQPPRFGLAALMTGITLLALLFAVVHYVGMLFSVIMILFALCVVAHIAGNAIGTQLRHLGNLPEQGDHEPAEKRRLRTPSPEDFAPVSRLRERNPLGKRHVAITFVGALAGGILGGCGLLWLGGRDTTWLVGVLGFSASAVLGGIWTFAASSFVHVMLGAWFHASKDLRRDATARLPESE